MAAFGLTDRQAECPGLGDSRHSNQRDRRRPELVGSGRWTFAHFWLCAANTLGASIVAQMVKRRRIKLKEGDILQFGLPDGRFGYAVVVDHGVLPSGGTPYIAVFASAYTGVPDVAKLAEDTLALAGWTTDALVYHNQWKVVGHAFPVPALPLPISRPNRPACSMLLTFEGHP